MSRIRAHVTPDAKKELIQLNKSLIALKNIFKMFKT